MLVFRACYDDVPPAAGATGATGAATGATGTDDPPVANQADLNAVLKREKEKFRKEREKLVQQLEQHSQSARLTTEQKDALEVQIEELRQANMTAEERARHQAKQLEKEYTGKLDSATGLAKTWETRFQDLKIGYEIKGAAVTHEVLPNNVEFVEAWLRPRTRMVQDVDDEGKPIDSWTAKVKFDDLNKDGKPIQLDLPVADALKRMKELPDRFGNLFKGAAVGGAGGNTGTPGRKPNIASLSTAEYMEVRKKDPASLGLK